LQTQFANVGERVTLSQVDLLKKEQNLDSVFEIGLLGGCFLCSLRAISARRLLAWSGCFWLSASHPDTMVDTKQPSDRHLSVVQIVFGVDHCDVGDVCSIYQVRSKDVVETGNCLLVPYQHH
jgi:hypothetical protein